MPDESNLFRNLNIRNNIKYYISIPKIDLPNYSEYIYNGNEEYDDHNLKIDGLFNYTSNDYIKNIIKPEDIEIYDYDYNLFFHNKTGIILEYVNDNFKIFGKCDEFDNNKINKLNYTDMILAYKYHMLNDMQYFIIDGKFRLDVIRIKSNIDLYLDLFSGYIFTLYDISQDTNNIELITLGVILKIDEDNVLNMLTLEDYFATGEYGFKVNKNTYSLYKNKLKINNMIL